MTEQSFNCSDTSVYLPQNLHNLSSSICLNLQPLISLDLQLNDSSHDVDENSEPSFWSFYLLASRSMDLTSSGCESLCNLKRHSIGVVERSNHLVANINRMENRYFDKKLGGCKIHKLGPPVEKWGNWGTDFLYIFRMGGMIPFFHYWMFVPWLAIIVGAESTVKETNRNSQQTITLDSS